MWSPFLNLSVRNYESVQMELLEITKVLGIRKVSTLPRLYLPRDRRGRFHIEELPSPFNMFVLRVLD